MFDRKSVPGDQESDGRWPNPGGPHSPRPCLIKLRAQRFLSAVLEENTSEVTEMRVEGYSSHRQLSLNAQRRAGVREEEEERSEFIINKCFSFAARWKFK